MADYLWNFVEAGGGLPVDPTLPIPSNTHWMPLAAVVQGPFLLLISKSRLAAALPFWIVGPVAAPLTWWIGRDAGVGRVPAAAAGQLVALRGGPTPFLSQPDNFGLFMTLGALSLWLCARGMRGDRRAFLLGGFVVGRPHLRRSGRGAARGSRSLSGGAGPRRRAKCFAPLAPETTGGATVCVIARECVQ